MLYGLLWCFVFLVAHGTFRSRKTPVLVLQSPCWRALTLLQLQLYTLVFIDSIKNNEKPNKSCDNRLSNCTLFQITDCFDYLNIWCEFYGKKFEQNPILTMSLFFNFILVWCQEIFKLWNFNIASYLLFNWLTC